jgi:hypothetical protein
MPNSRTLNGTSTLFAAFEVATTEVPEAHKKRGRCIEFPDFMNDIVAAWQPQHPQTQERPLAQAASERDVPLHTDPPPSGLNQVEIWFLILQDPPLSDQSFTSVKQLREHIGAFVDDYNVDAKPFVWTKSEVHQKRLKARFADL